jgi:hypothetical protein
MLRGPRRGLRIAAECLASCPFVQLFKSSALLFGAPAKRREIELL